MALRTGDVSLEILFEDGSVELLEALYVSAHDVDHLLLVLQTESESHISQIRQLGDGRVQQFFVEDRFPYQQQGACHRHFQVLLQEGVIEPIPKRKQPHGLVQPPGEG